MKLFWTTIICKEGSTKKRAIAEIPLNAVQELSYILSNPKSTVYDRVIAYFKRSSFTGDDYCP